ncbi:F-Box/Lrr-Repeat Protein 5 [Manis pentadactyla]|nr:F-Box/Lrr-Repeat Protein 5 [Manis pentadactyla]
MTVIRKVTSSFRTPSPPGLQLEGWVGWGRYLLSKGPSTDLDLEPGGEQETVRGDRSQPKALCAEESERSGWAVVRHQKRPPSKEVTSRVAPRRPGYSTLGQLKAALPWAGAPEDDLGLREHLFLSAWVGSLVIACPALSRTQGCQLLAVMVCPAQRQHDNVVGNCCASECLEDKPSIYCSLDKFSASMSLSFLNSSNWQGCLENSHAQCMW